MAIRDKDGYLHPSTPEEERERGERFVSDGTGVHLVENQCRTCKHRRRGTPGCDAFDVIPLDILLGRHDHRLPYPGDGGILYEPVPKV